MRSLSTCNLVQCSRRIFACCLLLLLAACAAPTDVVRHDLHVTIVYASQTRINEEAMRRGSPQRVHGFYDPLTNEIWCPNDQTRDAMLVCGHELRHAVFGSFHKGDARSFAGASVPGLMAFRGQALR